MKFFKPLDPVAVLWSQCLKFSLSVTGVSLPFPSKPASSWLELHSVSGSLNGLMLMHHLTPTVGYYLESINEISIRAFRYKENTDEQK